MLGKIKAKIDDTATNLQSKSHTRMARFLNNKELRHNFGKHMGIETGSERSGEVDALRCFAMLAVIALHTHIMPMGWIGVWLFYVISGYVVTLSVIGREEATSGLSGFGAFIWRRSVRILPVYYGYLLLGMGVAALIGAGQTLFSLSSLILFFDNVAMIMGSGRINGWPTGHLWTLSVEMQFYIVYGLALCFLPQRAVRGLLVALLLLCPLGRYIGAEILSGEGWHPLDAAYAIYAAPGLHFDSFACGGLLAFTRIDGTISRIARPLFIIGFGTLGLYMAAYFAVNHFVRGDHGMDMTRNVISGILIGEHREVFLYTVLGCAMAGLVALAAAGDKWLAPLLQVRALQWIGRISYGGYIFHQLAVIAASCLLMGFGFTVRHGTFGTHVVQFVLSSGLAILLAWISYRWFEQPITRMMHREPGSASTGKRAKLMELEAR